MSLSLSLLERLPLDEAGRVLDTGAGVGALLQEIDRRIPHGVAVGVDLSEGMIAQAPRTQATAVMDARRLGFEPGTFDIAICAFMLFHVPEPVEVLREAARVLRPGGTIGTITWGDDPSYLALDIWSDELEAHGAAPPEPSLSRHDLVNTEGKVTGLLETAGFDVTSTWLGTHEMRMSPDEFIAHRIGHGMTRRRFVTLDESVRPAFLQRVKQRLEGLGPGALTDRAEVVYALARRP